MADPAHSPQRLRTNENGVPLCPVIHVGYRWVEPEGQAPVPQECGEEAWLLAEAALPLDVGVAYAMKHMGAIATAASWRVECARGHVLAMSDNDEYAEDFQWNLVFGVDQQTNNTMKRMMK